MEKLHEEPHDHATSFASGRILCACPTIDLEETRLGLAAVLHAAFQRMAR
jgi:hypothetical protein